MSSVGQVPKYLFISYMFGAIPRRYIAHDDEVSLMFSGRSYYRLMPRCCRHRGLARGYVVCVVSGCQPRANIRSGAYVEGSIGVLDY